MLNNNGTGAALASPRYNPPAYDPLAEVIKRIQRDADRLDAVAADDAAFFEAHPTRNFHLRAATPHERDAGIAYDFVLVGQAAPGVRLRIPITCDFRPGLRDGILASVPEYDTEARAAATFDRIAPRYTSQNTNAGLYKVVQKLRRKRAKVSRSKNKPRC
jgi:hypothetical protein